MKKYYAEITNIEGKYQVFFPDLEGCFTESDSLEEALLDAQDVLKLWLSFHADEGIKLPAPAKHQELQGMAIVPISA